MEALAIIILISLLVQLTMWQMSGRKVVTVEHVTRAGVIEGAWIIQAIKKEGK